MSLRRLAVVSSGLRQPSSTRMLADRLSAATEEALTERRFEVQTAVIELRDHARDLTDYLLDGTSTESLQSAFDAVVFSHGVVAATPVFSASYTGMFKNFFDSLPSDSLRGKPVLIGATAGTARHSLALEHAVRPLFTYLRAMVVPTSVFATSGDWGAPEGADQGLAGRIARAGSELADLMIAYSIPGPPEPHDAVIPHQRRRDR
ncbi:MAG: CE1759 family FMN reductase [Actinomycetota bacterium]